MIKSKIFAWSYKQMSIYCKKKKKYYTVKKLDYTLTFDKIIKTNSTYEGQKDIMALQM